MRTTVAHLDLERPAGAGLGPTPFQAGLHGAQTASRAGLAAVCQARRSGPLTPASTVPDDAVARHGHEEDGLAPRSSAQLNTASLTAHLPRWPRAAGQSRPTCGAAGSSGRSSPESLPGR